MPLPPTFLGALTPGHERSGELVPRVQYCLGRPDAKALTSRAERPAKIAGPDRIRPPTCACRGISARVVRIRPPLRVAARDMARGNPQPAGRPSDGGQIAGSLRKLGLLVTGALHTGLAALGHGKALGDGCHEGKGASR